MNQINIDKKRTIYDVTCMYHSDMKCQNYDAKIVGIEEKNGKVSFEPDHCGESFEFYGSDPDRVIAIAQMMLSFAQMIKKNNQKKVLT